MENSILLNLEADVISLIFSNIITELDEFTTFSKLLIVWQRNQPTDHIKDVLERLNWDKVYGLHNHPTEVIRDQFQGFIGYCVRHNVTQGMFYNSTEELLKKENVQHHLQVLQSLSGTHFPSLVSFLFFKAIYRPFEIAETANEMFGIVNQTHLRVKLLELLNLLEEIYSRLFESDYLLPVYKFCPSARNLDPIYQLDGEPFSEELWSSLCVKVVEDNEFSEATKDHKGLTIKQIWNSQCPFCTLQLILFKVLLSAIPY